MKRIFIAALIIFLGLIFFIYLKSRNNFDEMANSSLNDFLKYGTLGVNSCPQSQSDSKKFPLSRKLFELDSLNKDCYRSYDEKIESGVGFLSYGDDKLPYVFFKKGKLINSQIYIYLIGGPIGGYPNILLPRERYYNPLFHHHNDFIVVYPSYLGTSDRTFYPKYRDFDESIKEIDSFILKISSDYPEIKINVIGESYGSILASRLKKNRINKLLLIGAPLGRNGENLLDHFLEKSSNVDLTKKLWSSGYSMTEKKIISISRYYYMKKNISHIAEELNAIKDDGDIDKACVWFISGSRDKLIKPGFNFDRLKGTNVYLVEGANHQNLYDFPIADRYLEKFIDSDCRRGS